ncbi:MAG TPA: hypothetical protein VIM73_01200 [Polyangiaceae bacterium]
MLRITRIQEAGGPCLTLEGRLVGESVTLLQTELFQTELSNSRADQAIVALDLSAVHFADAAAILLLRAARARGILLRECSPLLVSLIGSPSR